MYLRLTSKSIYFTTAVNIKHTRCIFLDKTLEKLLGGKTDICSLHVIAVRLLTLWMSLTFILVKILKHQSRSES